MIFEQPFDDNLYDKCVFFSFYWPKTIEREKRREKISASCEYKRENCLKIVTKWSFKYHFSLENK